MDNLERGEAMNPYHSKLIVAMKPHSVTQIAIQNAFISLYAEKNVHRITVKELCIAAPVARTTFYTYYQNIDELLAEIEDTLVANITETCRHFMSEPCSDEHGLSFFEDTLQYIQENNETFYALMIKQPDIRFIEKWKNAIKYHFWERLFHEREGVNEGLILEIIASETIGAFTYWLKYPNDVDSTKIKKIILAQLRTLEYIN